MPKLPGVNHLAAIRALEKIGFLIIRQGKHVTMSDGLRIVQIPRANPVNAYTMGNIAKQCGLSPDGFGGCSEFRQPPMDLGSGPSSLMLRRKFSRAGCAAGHDYTRTMDCLPKHTNDAKTKRLRKCN